MNIDGFLRESSKFSVTSFILLLGDEYPYLDYDHWMAKAPYYINFVRLTEDEFRMLDYGKHPKFIIYKNNKELFNSDGIPNTKQIEKIISFKKGI